MSSFDSNPNPYQSGPEFTIRPATPRPVAKPAVVMWFHVYAGILCFMYVLVAAVSLVFFAADAEMEREMDIPVGSGVPIGVMFLVMGLGLAAATAVPFFVQPRPWVWIYDMVLICMGMTSACFVLACVPMLIFWMKPEVKAYFGRAPN